MSHQQVVHQSMNHRQVSLANHRYYLAATGSNSRNLCALQRHREASRRDRRQDEEDLQQTSTRSISDRSNMEFVSGRFFVCGMNGRVGVGVALTIEQAKQSGRIFKLSLKEELQLGDKQS